MAQELTGAPVAAALCEQLAPRVEALADHGAPPRLAILRVGANEGDLSYERGATKRCAGLGIQVDVHALPADCTQEELIATIEALNADDAVHGILMFRPLPSTLDEAAACAAILPAKDVDGVTPDSLYGVFANRPVGFAPCTAAAVIELLHHYGVRLEGARATVVGRSLVIGRPVACMLQAANATVTLCHSRTADLSAECSRADIVVAALGHARAIGAGYVSEGAVVVDVGINWDEASGRLVGDVDFDAVEPLARGITPVPRGVGSVTTAVLAKHVVEAAERAVAAGR